jgi:predicted Zn-dependent protease
LSGPQSYRPETWRNAARAALLAAVALAVAGCAASPVDSRIAALPDPPRQTAPVVTPAQREHQRILSGYGGAYDNPRLEALISRTVEKLVAASDRPDLHYQITILNSPAVNAFALPTGHLYVTRGLLALANDEAELASVLSHEMAHVIARHAAMREDQARQAALVNRVVHDVLNDPKMGALALAKSKIALASFSRAQELEADAIGVGIASRAGFDPYGATRFLTDMGRNAALKPTGAANEGSRPADFLSSHPSTPDRVKNAIAIARQHGAPGGGIRDKKDYLGAIAGLAFGEDPSEGFIRGRRFLHPKLDIAFTAPDGFTLDNTAQAVLGVKAGGNQAMRFDVVRVPQGQGLKEYLTSGWIEHVDMNSLHDLTIGGLPAATATAKGDHWSFTLYAIRSGGDVYRFVFASKHRTPDTDDAFRAAAASFHRLSPSEVAQARPLHLEIVTVAPGDTAATMAARMATDRPLERFLVLNGLSNGQALTPGDQVKIVVE